MEHNLIVISSADEMGSREKVFITDWKVEYAGEFIELSYVFNPTRPLQYIHTIIKI